LIGGQDRGGAAERRGRKGHSRNEELTDSGCPNDRHLILPYGVSQWNGVPSPRGALPFLIVI
jgi:hypothetical protein